MRSLRHPATLIATVALIVALTGSAYASGLISGKQIRNGTITGAKLANHTVTGSKLANGTISLGNLSKLVLDGLNYFTVAYGQGSVAAGSSSVVEAHCASNEIPVSGGYVMASAVNSVTVQIDALDQSSNAWMAAVKNAGTGPVGVTVEAICAS